MCCAVLRLPVLDTNKAQQTEDAAPPCAWCWTCPQRQRSSSPLGRNGSGISRPPFDTDAKPSKHRRDRPKQPDTNALFARSRVLAPSGHRRVERADGRAFVAHSRGSRAQAVQQVGSDDGGADLGGRRPGPFIRGNLRRVDRGSTRPRSVIAPVATMTARRTRNRPGRSTGRVRAGGGRRQ